MNCPNGTLCKIQGSEVSQTTAATRPTLVLVAAHEEAHTALILGGTAAYSTCCILIFAISLVYRRCKRGSLCGADLASRGQGGIQLEERISSRTLHAATIASGKISQTGNKLSVTFANPSPASACSNKESTHLRSRDTCLESKKSELESSRTEMAEHPQTIMSRKFYAAKLSVQGESESHHTKSVTELESTGEPTRQSSRLCCSNPVSELKKFSPSVEEKHNTCTQYLSKNSNENAIESAGTNPTPIQGKSCPSVVEKHPTYTQFNCNENAIESAWTNPIQYGKSSPSKHPTYTQYPSDNSNENAIESAGTNPTPIYGKSSPSLVEKHPTYTQYPSSNSNESDVASAGTNPTPIPYVEKHLTYPSSNSNENDVASAGTNPTPIHGKSFPSLMEQHPTYTQYPSYSSDEIAIELDGLKPTLIHSNSSPSVVENPTNTQLPSYCSNENPIESPGSTPIYSKSSPCIQYPQPPSIIIISDENAAESAGSKSTPAHVHPCRPEEIGTSLHLDYCKSDDPMMAHASMSEESISGCNVL